jgi:protein-arginine kinase activator protein McsA
MRVQRLVVTNDDKLERCNQCHQTLSEIHSHDERLIGCFTCNLWATVEGKRWKRLSEEDLRSFHRLRHKQR